MNKVWIFYRKAVWQDEYSVDAVFSSEKKAKLFEKERYSLHYTTMIEEWDVDGEL